MWTISIPDKDITAPMGFPYYTAVVNAPCGEERAEGAIRLNPAGKEHAQQLIAAGKVDLESDWSFDAEDGNKLLGPNGDDWETFAKFHLGIREDTNPKTKEHYAYPFGKEGKVYRRGLIAAKQRAAQQGHSAILEAATDLLALIDHPEEAAPELTPTTTDPMTKNLVFTPVCRSARGEILDEERRIVRATINTNSVDSYESIVLPRGARLERFRKNPQVLWNHDHYYPIGRALVDSIKVTENAIVVDYQFYDFSRAKALGPIASLVEDLWYLVKNSHLIGYSVGFLPIKTTWRDDDILVFEEWELFEFSLTPVPANPDTLAGDANIFGRYIRSLARTQDPLKFRIFVDQLPEFIKAAVKAELRQAEREAFRSLERRANLAMIEKIKQEGFEIQTLIFDKAQFTLDEAIQWCQDHGFRADKVDETENTYRFRQFDPSECAKDSFRTWELTDGVQATGCSRQKTDAATQQLEVTSCKLEVTPHSMTVTVKPDMQDPAWMDLAHTISSSIIEALVKQCHKCQEQKDQIRALEQQLAAEKELSALLAKSVIKLKKAQE